MPSPIRILTVVSTKTQEVRTVITGVTVVPGPSVQGKGVMQEEWGKEDKGLELVDHDDEREMDTEPLFELPDSPLQAISPPLGKRLKSRKFKGVSSKTADKMVDSGEEFGDGEELGYGERVSIEDP
jgi:hypothetical protein